MSVLLTWVVEVEVESCDTLPCNKESEGERLVNLHCDNFLSLLYDVCNVLCSACARYEYDLPLPRVHR